MDDSAAPPTQALTFAAGRAEAVLWHQAWLGAVLIALAVLVLAVGVTWAGAAALLCGALPAALGLLVLRGSDTPAGRTGLVVVWALGGAAACVLAGGASGPLGVWCLAPILAATVLGSGRLVAQAAAWAMIAAAAAGLAQATGTAGALPPLVGFWLGMIGLLTAGTGAAAGLILTSGRAARRQASDRAAYDVVERLLTQQPHLLVSLDRNGRIGSAFGYAPQGVSEGLLLGAGLLAAAEPADRPGLETALQAALAKGAAETAFTPIGAPHHACALSLRRAGDGGLVGMLRDASLQRAREASLEAGKIEAEQLNAGKTRFLANMSHELRTPLNAIMGFSDMMRARLFGPLTGKYGEYAELIHESGGHLLDLINDVLDMSKIEADAYQLSIETFDAREPVSAALRLMRQQADDAGISLRGVLPARDMPVDADSRALKQMVLNLVSNALKFTPRGGEVTVSLRASGDRAELVVADTGLGIAGEDLARLGRPYEQAGSADQRAKGSGLGLSLVRAFAELHGGDMTIESELGEGTSVIIRLPVLHTDGDRLSAKVIAFAPTR